MTNLPGVLGAAIAIVAIIGATVAVCLGHIDGSAFTGIVAGVGGGGLGAGAHAAGVKQGAP
jgi:hypothetical protein